MPSIGLFAEDYGHEAFVGALLRRVAADREVELSVQTITATGGHAEVVRELRAYVRDLRRKVVQAHDALVIATDTNCQTLAERKRNVDNAIGMLEMPVVAALPNPHIERWMLLDSAAFKSVFGQGCDAPDQKCERARYKQLLRASLKKCHHTPLLGGMEFAKDIVQAMNLRRVHGTDESLGGFLDEISSLFARWEQSR